MEAYTNLIVRRCLYTTIAVPSAASGPRAGQHKARACAADTTERQDRCRPGTFSVGPESD